MLKIFTVEHDRSQSANRSQSKPIDNFLSHIDEPLINYGEHQFYKKKMQDQAIKSIRCTNLEKMAEKKTFLHKFYANYA